MSKILLKAFDSITQFVIEQIIPEGSDPLVGAESDGAVDYRQVNSKRRLAGARQATHDDQPTRHARQARSGSA